MRFEIDRTRNWWDLEDILETYPCLKDYNFEIKEFQIPAPPQVIRDENGKFIIFDDGKTHYTTRKKAYIHVDSLESLIELIHKTGNRIVIEACEDNDGELTIEIYDGFRE